MNAIELAKLMATNIAQGRGEFEVKLFQWLHQAESITEVLVRPGTNEIELYSGTAPASAAAPTDEDDDLLGFDDNDDLI